MKENLVKGLTKGLKRAARKVWREVWNVDTALCVVVVTACVMAVFFGY